ncbi:MAG: hypothetical protein NC393_03620 [Clostridium sp.]|nr:hypothetical protein [Clostridium sp.]
MNKQKKENQVLVIQKYKGSVKGIISMIIALIIAFICYVIMLYLAQNSEISSDMQVKIVMIRDVLLAVISIIGTSLLTSVFIEKNRKNVDYTELIANDIFASPEFYMNLTEENKEKMLTYLSENSQKKDPVRSELYNLYKEKLIANQFEYYYEDFDESTSYYDFGSYSEKRSKRIIKLRSYKEKVNIKKLRLIAYKLSPTHGIETFELLGGSIGIESEPLVVGKEIVVETSSTRSPFLVKNGYVQTFEVSLYKEITLYPNKDTVIGFEYISRVSDEDMSSGVGVSVPCKRFSLNFYAPSGYKVYAHTFGFLDSGDNISNT